MAGSMHSSPLVAVDIGNARTKIAVFSAGATSHEPLPGDGGRKLPEPRRMLHLADETSALDEIGPWLAAADAACENRPSAWWIASVNRPACTRLVDWLRGHRPQDAMTLLTASDLPLRVEVERPDMVGVDRLLDAVAANHLRQPDRPAVVVDVGTAITVDLVSAAGAFRGGSILPGIAMSARAMHAFTDLLPLLDMSELNAPPPALGTSTVPAIRSGLFWGAVGAIRQLIDQLAGDDHPQVILTGGAGPAVAELLGPAARHVPNLTLAGIALTVRESAGHPLTGS